MSTVAPNQTTYCPVVQQLVPSPDPVEVFERLAALRNCVFFDSAQRHERLGRYSYVAADPFDVISLRGTSLNAFAALRSRLENYQTDTIEGLPPFQGGAAGLFSYDLCHHLEHLPRPRYDEFQVADLCIGFYDVVIAFDHRRDEAWIISQGFPETELAARCARAVRRADEMLNWITATKPPRPAALAREPRLPEKQLAPQFPMPELGRLTSNLSRHAYLRAVERIIEYICAGDVFQVNFAQRLMHTAESDSVAFYLRLRQENAAPFGGYFDEGSFQVLSTSPERFLRVHSNRVEARPIKGTGPRTALPEADFYAGDRLRESEKDRAENVMIVDLLRNDLSKVCRADSVRVTQLCEVENYAYVQHLVSAIEGSLREDRSALDLLQAAFPGGSITGAPKVRAMEIIAELEPTARGPYCGSLAYIGFDGSMDSSILIRTVTAGHGWWQIPVGGGIVAASDPDREYKETWHKAEGMLRAVSARR